MDKKDALRITNDYINKLLLNELHIHSAYMFGSFSKGDNNKDSDIDLAIVFDTLVNTFETEIKLMTLRKGDETIIEPHVFEKDEFVKINPFINEILETGIKVI